MENKEQYLVVESSDVQELARQVNELLSAGYKLGGNLVVHNLERFITKFYQPLILKGTK
jgi:ribulose bisphosphate carboxylase small subunit